MSNSSPNGKDVTDVETNSSFRKVASENHISTLTDSENGKANRIVPRPNLPKVCRIIFAITAHILLLIGISEPFWVLKPPLNDQTEYSLNILFKWHVTLSMIAVGLYTESLWVFNGTIGLFPFLSPGSKFKVHLLVCLCTCVFLVCEWITASYNHFLSGRPYFGTWHGLLGLFLNIYAILHWLCGFSLLHDRLRTNFVMEIYIWSLVLILTFMAIVLYTSMFSFWFTRTFYGASWHLHFFVLVGWYFYTLVTLLTIRNQVYL